MSAGQQSSTDRTDSTDVVTVEEPRPEGDLPEDKRRKRLASYTVRNMVWSMLLVLAFVLVWWSLTFNPEESQVPPAEVGVVSSFAATEADWPVWVPDPGDDWQPTVAWFDERVEGVRTWHVSYVSPAGEYVALHQAADASDEWQDSVLADAVSQDETVALTGPAGEQPWALWKGREDGNVETAFLLGPERTGGTTVVLHGTADQEEFEAFLRSVHVRD